MKPNNEEEKVDYFEAYEDLEVHHLMLQDGPRNEAYKQAIFQNKDFIKGKIVLDVGAGTGILSVFCAQAGADKVFAVEASNFYKIAEEVVKENKFENVIDVIHSKVEDLTLPNNIKVDIIVSEWMGFYLLHEGMLDSVLYARDHFLKDNGILFPESAAIYAAPCSLPSVYDFWNNISGVSMKCVGELYRQFKSQKPEILNISKENLLHEGTILSWIDLKEIRSDELHTIYERCVVASSKNGPYQGLCLWFTCNFPSLNNEETIVLSTAPGNSKTHWKQTVIVLPHELTVEEGSPIAFKIYLKRCADNFRRYNIEFTMLDPEEIKHPEPCECHMTKCIIIKKMLEQYETGESTQMQEG